VGAADCQSFGGHWIHFDHELHVGSFGAFAAEFLGMNDLAALMVAGGTGSVTGPVQTRPVRGFVVRGVAKRRAQSPVTTATKAR